MADFIGLATLVAASTTGCATIIVALKGNSNGRKLDEAVGKQEQIHTLVNSNMAEIKRQLEAALAAKAIAEAKLTEKGPIP